MSAVALIAAALLLGVAGFQAGLAGGAPWGAASYGGRAATEDGRLPMPMRVMSGIAVIILVLAAWTVLAQGGVVGSGPVSDGALRNVTWGIAAYLALNALGNLASKSRTERVVMGSVSLILVVLTVLVAWQGEGPA
ncbi:MAG: hypothetical protein QNJ88_18070 [Acidimicrobiia bacterium]|nr:hypothetical protein [Acidimicrobiia bacterium]